MTDLSGKQVEGKLRPSSDLATHVLLYKEFPSIGGVVHTHSEFATAWAQAGLEIPAYGTTHADYFYGPVPVTDELTAEEIGGDYVLNTGVAIARRFQGLDPTAIPAVLVAGHAPFCWGPTPNAAAHNAAVLETVARMAYYTANLRQSCTGVSQALLDRHYFRKHGCQRNLRTGEIMVTSLAMVAATQLARLNWIDILVIAIYFAIVMFIGFYLRGSLRTPARSSSWRGPRDDRLGLPASALSPPTWALWN